MNDPSNKSFAWVGGFMRGLHRFYPYIEMTSLVRVWQYTFQLFVVRKHNSMFTVLLTPEPGETQIRNNKSPGTWALMIFVSTHKN